MMTSEKKITEEDLDLDNEDTSSYYESSDESVDGSKKPEEHSLSDNWTVWYHRLNDKDWTINGYKKIFTFSTIEGFWRVYNTLIRPGENDLSNTPFILRGDFFIMKNDILPMWEDSANLEGCSESYLTKERDEDKEMDPSDFEEWRELGMFLISNYGKNINGISSSPKQKNFLLKIWKGDCEDTVIDGDMFKIDFLDVKRKIHKESAEKETSKNNNRRSNNNRGGGGKRYDRNDRNDRYNKNDRGGRNYRRN